MSQLSSEQLCLFERAQETWNLRSEAKRWCLPLNEESMTELLLLNLKRHYPSRITIQPFNKHEEAKTGGDWSWTFISHDRKWSQSMLVQAKRLDDLDHCYTKIDYRIGRKTTNGKPRIRQIDQLIKTGKKQKQVPIYFFYNHLSDPSCIPSNCGTLHNSKRLLPNSWGISFASAISVRKHLPDKRFDQHKKYSFPFHCLLCSQGYGDSPVRRPKGSPGVVAEMMSRLFSEDEFDDELSRRDMSTLLGPAEGVPAMVTMAEQVAALDDPQERDQEAEMLGREFHGIAGAVIFRDSANPENN